MDLLTFCLVTWGLTNIIVTSDILEPIRELASKYLGTIGSILTCFMCSGFWVGVALSALVGGPALAEVLAHQETLASIHPWAPAVVGKALDGFLAGGVAWTAFLILSKYVGDHDHEE